MLSNFDMLFYSLAFVVPGFITYTIVSMFVPQKNEQAPNSILRFLYFSCMNYALWSWLIYIIVKTDFYNQHKFWTAAIWILIVLISPIITGLMLGILSKNEVIRKLLHKLGFNTTHPIPTGWDYKFSSLKNGVWVIVTLKDDSIVTGYFGSNSFASSDCTERDLYIESIYKIGSDDSWYEVDRTDGMLIKGDQIKNVEFKKEEA